MKKLLLEMLPVVGLVRTLVGKERGERYNWRIGATEMIIAVFAGLLVHWACTELGYSANIEAIAVSLAGYSARCVLTILSTKMMDKMKGV